jgi:Cdc6-like AAA superfamily ATPase
MPANGPVFRALVDAGWNLATRKSRSNNGRDRLEDAIATLIQNQAAFLAQTTESERRHVDFERRHNEFERQHHEFERQTAERFARIEAQMAEIVRVLADHGRILERLTEAVREKIGFKGQE